MILLINFAFLEAQKRIESIRFMSAAERYAELERKYTGISNRLPLKYLASYLGTTPVSLSRIRSGIQCDAAHATTPNMGQGACMAVEDAVVLIECLRKNSIVKHAFAHFEKKRLERTHYIVNQS